MEKREGPLPEKEELCPVCNNRVEDCVCCPECGHVCAHDEDELVCPVCGPVVKEPVNHE